MLIDWFTVGAQVLNFLILVWLLKRFLYKPILNAIDAREKLIAAELPMPTTKKAEAQKEHDEFQTQEQDSMSSAARCSAKATDEAKVEHERLLDRSAERRGLCEAEASRRH
jgi:F-type H+-transporting ATPase subunit b